MECAADSLSLALCEAQSANGNAETPPQASPACESAEITCPWSDLTARRVSETPFRSRASRFILLPHDTLYSFAWVKENAETYHLDVDKVIIGGQSRGSYVSWALAHSGDPAILGIYMGQALPGNSFDERLLEPITKEAPPIFLTYRKEPGVVGDIHDPAHGLKVIGKYKELGIGDRAELVHTLSKTKNNDVMQFLTKFVRAIPGQAESGSKK